MNEIAVTDDIKIEDMIYEIRGKYVMLDSDLGRVYECKNGTKTINQAVNRHLERFPSDFYFQLMEDEYNSLRSQVGTLKNGRGEHKKYLPYVFTEQGVAMLATVLRTKVASEMSVSIMRAFVKMRHYLLNTVGENKYIKDMLLKHDNELSEHGNSIRLLQESFDKLETDKEIDEVYFNGKAKDKLIVVDRYTDKTFLDMIRNLDCKVILITGKKSKLTKLDIDKYNQDYNNLTVYYDDTFHDRYFVIDDNKVYHSGNSINHIGYRKSGIDVIHDKNVCATVINDIGKIIGGKE